MDTLLIAASLVVFAVTGFTVYSIIRLAIVFTQLTRAFLFTEYAAGTTNEKEVSAVIWVFVTFFSLIISALVYLGFYTLLIACAPSSVV